MSDEFENAVGAALPRDVLVVEDSLIIALDIEEMIKELGVASVRVESSVAGALGAITNRQPDFAIVDYNLGEETSAPVARKLSARGVSFVLATGQSNTLGGIEDLGALAILVKPFAPHDIERVLKANGSG